MGCYGIFWSGQLEMYSINQHFKTSTSLIIQNIINIEPVYTGPESFFNGQKIA